MLRETEKVLSIEKEKHKQIKSVYTPWPAKKRKYVESVACTCTCTPTKSEIPTTTQSISNNDSSIVDSIPKIVSKTKALRINPCKSSLVKFVDAKKSIKDVITTKSKPVSVIASKNKIVSSKYSKSTTALVTKKSSVGTAVSHSPSCLLYGSEINTMANKSLSYLNLTEAVNAYGVPTSLQRTLDDYYKFVLYDGKIDDITKNARHAYIKNLNKHVSYNNAPKL